MTRSVPLGVRPEAPMRSGRSTSPQYANTLLYMSPTRSTRFAVPRVFSPLRLALEDRVPWTGRSITRARILVSPPPIFGPHATGLRFNSCRPRYSAFVHRIYLRMCAFCLRDNVIDFLDSKSPLHHTMMHTLRSSGPEWVNCTVVSVRVFSFCVACRVQHCRGRFDVTLSCAIHYALVISC